MWTVLRVRNSVRLKKITVIGSVTSCTYTPAPRNIPAIRIEGRKWLEISSESHLYLSLFHSTYTLRDFLPLPSKLLSFQLSTC